jgi:hypothetical protein
MNLLYVTSSHSHDDIIVFNVNILTLMPYINNVHAIRSSSISCTSLYVLVVDFRKYQVKSYAVCISKSIATRKNESPFYQRILQCTPTCCLLFVSILFFINMDTDLNQVSN